MILRPPILGFETPKIRRFSCDFGTPQIGRFEPPKLVVFHMILTPDFWFCDPRYESISRVSEVFFNSSKTLRELKEVLQSSVIFASA